MSEEADGRQRPDPDPVRSEAERLVAAGLAAVSMAADRIGAPTRERGGAAAASFDALGDMLFGPAGQRRHSVANDSPECCKCPVCRVIAAARQPSPTFAERLATGVGFMAEGAARVMRGVAGAAALSGAAGKPAAYSGAAGAARPEPSPAPGSPTPAEPDPWAAATSEPPASAPVPVSVPVPAPAMTVPPPAAPAKKTGAKAAKKTVKKTTKKAAAKKVVQSSRSGSQASPESSRPRKTTGDTGR